MKTDPGKIHSSWLPRLVIHGAGMMILILVMLFIPDSILPKYPYDYLIPALLGLTGAVLFICSPFIFKAASIRQSFLIQVLALIFAGSYSWLLRHSEFGVMGLESDSWFITAMVTRFSHSWGSKDFSYEGLSSFYPYLYHFLVGKSAWLTNTQPWLAIKPAAIFFSWLMPLLTFAFWKKIFPKGYFALLVTVVTMFMAQAHFLMVLKTYEAIVMMLAIPWYYYFLEQNARRSMKEKILGGFIGGLLFMTYFHPFLLLIVLWILSNLLRLIFRHPSGGKDPGFLKGTFVSWALTAAFCSPFWLPYMIDLLTHHSEPLQNRWFLIPYVALPDFEKLGFLEYAGLAWIVISSLNNRFPFFLLQVLVSLVIFNFLGQLGILLDFPFLHQKMEIYFQFVMLTGLAYGVIILGKRYQHKWLGLKYLTPVFLIGFLFSIIDGQLLYLHQNVDQYAVRAEANPNLTSDELEEVVTDKVLLSNETLVTTFNPAWQILNHNAHYSHPASEYRERLKWLTFLSFSDNQEFISWMLNYNRFNAVDLVFFPNSTIYRVMDDNFPMQEPHCVVNLDFSRIDTADERFYKRVDVFRGLYEVIQPEEDLYHQFDDTEKIVAIIYGKAELSEAISEAYPEMAEKAKAFSEILNRKICDYTSALGMLHFYLKWNPLEQDPWFDNHGFRIWKQDHLLIYVADTNVTDLSAPFFLHAYSVADSTAQNFDFYWKYSPELAVSNFAIYPRILRKEKYYYIETGQFRDAPGYPEIWKAAWSGN